jgi:flagella basal body P-ring formation protein FlgA
MKRQSPARRRLAFLMASSLLGGFPIAAMAEETASADPYGYEWSDAEPLRLRTSIMVDDEVVRLGDLFMDSLVLGDTPVARAPAPGQTISLDARFLRQLARAYRLDWEPDSKFEHVLIGRMSQRIDATQVEETLGDALRARGGNAAALDVTIDGGDVEFVLPTNLMPSVGVQNLQYDPSSQRFAALLVVPAEGPTALQRVVTGWAHETIEIPVFNRALPAGTTVQESDLDWISIRADRLVGNVVTDTRQLVGMTTRRPLRADQILRVSDLVMTPAVRKNTLVTLALQSGAMSLSLMGKVLEDAAIGQSVRVMNVNSKKELVGVVRDAGTVEIPIVGHLTLN